MEKEKLARDKAELDKMNALREEGNKARERRNKEAAERRKALDEERRQKKAKKEAYKSAVDAVRGSPGSTCACGPSNGMRECYCPPPSASLVLEYYSHFSRFHLTLQNFTTYLI